MTLTILIFVLIALAIASFIFTRPQTFELIQTKYIQASPEEVYNKLRDLQSWSEWSPWVIYELDCNFEYSETNGEEGSWYSWDGQRIGAGTLELTELMPPSEIEAKLVFKRPNRSTNSISFRIEPSGVGTEVSWKMQGHMPLMLKPMIPRIQKMLKNDFEIGLIRLNALLDPEAAGMRLEFPGTIELPAQSYVSRGFESEAQNLPEIMSSGFADLWEQMNQSNDLEPSGPAFTAIHSSSKQGTYFIGDMGIPIPTREASSEFSVRRYPGGKYLQMRYTGPYEHLRLAWHCAFANMNMSKVKLDLRRPWLEVYENRPTEVDDPRHLKSSIYIPIK
jgi:effector-binding domain-containing protein